MITPKNNVSIAGSLFATVYIPFASLPSIAFIICRSETLIIHKNAAVGIKGKAFFEQSCVWTENYQSP